MLIKKILLMKFVNFRYDNVVESDTHFYSYMFLYI